MFASRIDSVSEEYVSLYFVRRCSANRRFAYCPRGLHNGARVGQYNLEHVRHLCRGIQLRMIDGILRPAKYFFVVYPDLLVLIVCVICTLVQIYRSVVSIALKLGGSLLYWGSLYTVTCGTERCQ